MKGLFSLISCGFLLISQAAQSSFAEENAMLVLDGSGSMWGKAEGKTKIGIAKEVVGKLISDWPPEKNVGLMVYGHRRKGDCSDIEVLYTPKPLDRTVFMEQVRSISPKGKTPMTAAVRLAAEKLRYSEEAATVILVSDGEETCDLDPCAVASELEKEGINFTAHVVGFDIKNAGENARRQLACLAENTGGKFLSADSASELFAALSAVALEPTPAPTTVPEPEAAVNLRAVSILRPGMEPLTGGITWMLFKPEVGSDRDGKRVEHSYKDIFEVKVDPGKYLLRVKAGSVEKSKTIEVTDAAQKLEIDLDAGYALLKAKASEDGEVLSKGLTWIIKGKNLSKGSITSYAEEPRLLLPAGGYQLEVKWGKAKAQGEISVIAGEEQSTEIIMGAGVLQCLAFAAEGGEKLTEKLSWTVESAKQKLSGGYDAVAHSYNAEPSFSLAAGKYRLTAKWGKAVLTSEVEVKPNETTAASIVLNAGAAAFRAKDKEGQTIAAGTSWTIYEDKPSLTGKRKSIEHSYNANPQFLLPAGKYYAEVKVGSVAASQEFDIEAGQRTELEIFLAD